MVDALLQFIFLLALVLRMLSLALWQSEEELSHNKLERCDDNFPACHIYIVFLALRKFTSNLPLLVIHGPILTDYL